MVKKRFQQLNRIGLTREGWIYLLILSFISVGAVLRNVNLLILMSGLMFAPLIINWRLAVLRLKSLRAERHFPNRLHADQMATVQWVIENRSRLAAWNLVIHDQIQETELEVPPDQGISWKSRCRRMLVNLLWTVKAESSIRTGKIAVPLQQIHGEESGTLSYRVFFPRRGKYQMGPAQLTTRFPFGLIEASISLPAIDDFYVAPSVGNLSRSWNLRAQSMTVGSDTMNRKRGFEEDEFYALRPWRSGDSKKHIHWRTSAKQGFPVIKQYSQQSHSDFVVIVDLYSADNLPTEIEIERCQQALRFATTAFLSASNTFQKRVVFGICGAESKIIQGRQQAEILSQVMQGLAVAQPACHAQFVEFISNISDGITQHSPVYVISTRPDPGEACLLTSELAVTDGDRSSKQSRLHSIWPSVCWIDASSDKIHDLFSENSKENRAATRSLIHQWRLDHVVR